MGSASGWPLVQAPFNAPVCEAQKRNVGVLREVVYQHLGWKNERHSYSSVGNHRKLCFSTPGERGGSQVSRGTAHKWTTFWDSKPRPALNLGGDSFFKRFKVATIADDSLDFLGDRYEVNHIGFPNPEISTSRFSGALLSLYLNSRLKQHRGNTLENQPQRIPGGCAS